MKNFVAVGNTLTIQPPSLGAYVSGQGVLAGTLFGVAANDVSAAEVVAGAELVINVTGVYDLPKTTGQTWSVGAKIYWDNTNGVCTTTATGNALIGVSTVARINADASGHVRLNGAAV